MKAEEVPEIHKRNWTAEMLRKSAQSLIEFPGINISYDEALGILQAIVVSYERIWRDTDMSYLREELWGRDAVASPQTSDLPDKN